MSFEPAQQMAMPCKKKTESVKSGANVVINIFGVKILIT
jgi:hypothetical protein